MDIRKVKKLIGVAGREVRKFHPPPELEISEGGGIHVWHQPPSEHSIDDPKRRWQRLLHGLSGPAPVRPWRGRPATCRGGNTNRASTIVRWDPRDGRHVYYLARSTLPGRRKASWIFWLPK